MEIKGKCWKVRKKGPLLLALMEELEGNAHVSFEGNLRSLPLLNYPGASSEATDTLKRNTLWPKQDFVVAPLELSSSEKIYAALGGVVPRTVLHVQIEKDGVLQFGAYDNFHPECIFFSSAVTSQLLESLVSNEILQPLTGSGAKSRQVGEDASAHTVGGDGQRWFWLRSIPHITDTVVTNREFFQ